MSGQTRPGAVPRAKSASRSTLPTRARAILKGHTKSVEALAFSPDGKFLVSGAGDGTVRRWDVASGREQARYRAGDEDFIVEAVAVAPDGKTVAECGTDGGIRLWDVATNKALKALDSNRVMELAFLPDGATLVSSDYTAVRLFDVASGEEKDTIKPKSLVHTLAASSDGKLLAWGSFYKDRPNDLTVWDVAADKESVQLKDADIQPYAVGFSPDGAVLAACGLRDTGRKIEGISIDANLSVGVIKTWDLATGAVRGEFDVEKNRETNRTYSSLAFSPDGQILALGTWENSVEIWETAPLRRRGELKGHTDYVEAVAFSSDGKTLASAGRDSTIRLWDVRTAPAPASARSPLADKPGELRRFADHQGGAAAVAFSHDGRRALSGGEDADLRVWDVATGKNLHRLKGHAGPITGLAFTPDDRRAVTCSADRTVRLWDLAAGRELRRFEGHTAPVTSVAVTPDGRHALTGGEKELIVWDLATGRPNLKLEGVEEVVRSVAITPDGRLGLTGGDQKVLRTWDLKRGRPIRRIEGHDEPITAIAVAPDVQMAATGSEDDSVSLWDLRTGDESARIAEEHEGGVTAVALTRAGRLLTGSGDGKLRVWDGPAERLLLTLEGHKGAVTSVAFAPDGRTALSAGADGTVRLWSLGLGGTPINRDRGVPSGRRRR